MSFEADGLGIRSAGLPLLRDLVHERGGLYYDHGRLDSLADRMAPLVAARGFSAFLDYYYYLKYDAAADDEWTRVFDALSVPETYFWREVEQLRAAVEHVLPRLVSLYAPSPVRIWSMPCASGEEPLTLAMLLYEAGWFERAAIEIFAGDASGAAIARAKRGEYRERSFRTLSEERRERYFERCGEQWRVRPFLHQRVTEWQALNVMEPLQMHRVGTAPLIFCRNMFIYFSPEAVKRVVDTFADVMPSPGFLCVSASESLLRFTNRFELEEIGGSFMYVKRPDTAARLQR